MSTYVFCYVRSDWWKHGLDQWIGPELRRSMGVVQWFLEVVLHQVVQRFESYFSNIFPIPFIKMDSTNIERRYGVLTGSTAKDQPTFYTTSKHYAGVVVATTFCYKLLYNKVGLLHVV